MEIPAQAKKAPLGRAGFPARAFRENPNFREEKAGEAVEMAALSVAAIMTEAA